MAEEAAAVVQNGETSSSTVAQEARAPFLIFFIIIIIFFADSHGDMKVKEGMNRRWRSSTDINNSLPIENRLGLCCTDGRFYYGTTSTRSRFHRYSWEPGTGQVRRFVSQTSVCHMIVAGKLGANLSSPTLRAKLIRIGFHRNNTDHSGVLAMKPKKKKL